MSDMVTVFHLFFISQHVRFFLPLQITVCEKQKSNRISKKISI